MKRILVVIAFSLTAAAMVSSVVFGIVSSEIRLATGQKLRIRVAAFDPSDLLRGRYLALRPAGFSRSDLDALSLAALQPNGRVYAILKKDEAGFSSLRSVSDSEPSADAYLLLSCDASGRLEPPFDRFYLNQEEAPQAEELMRKYSGKDVYVDAFMKDGALTLSELHVGQRSFRAGKD